MTKDVKKFLFHDAKNYNLFSIEASDQSISQSHLKTYCQKMGLSNINCGLAHILEVFPDAVFVLDCRHHLVFANRACLDLMGVVDQKSIMGKSYWRVFKNIQKGQNKVLSVGDQLFKFRYFDMFSEHSDDGFSVCFFSDITQEYQLNQKMKWSLNDFKNIYYQLKTPFLLIDDQKNIVSQNTQVVKLLGYQDDDVLGKNVSFFLTKKDNLRFICETKNKKNNALMIDTIRVDAIKKDGCVVPLELRLSSVHLEGKVNCWLIALHDITKEVKMTDNLAYRMEFEKVMSGISKVFANLQASDIDNGIAGAIKKIGQFSNVERAYVFLFSDDFLTMSNTHEWCDHRSPHCIDHQKSLSVKSYPWFMEQMKICETLYIPNIKKLPKECKKEKKEWLSRGIQSLLIVPIVMQNKRIGFVGFDSLGQQKPWTQYDISLLLMTSEMIGQALARKRDNQKKKAALDREKNTFILTIQSIAHMIEIRDPYTAGHQRRVSQLAVAMGKRLNLSESQLLGLRLGALIHDIGKICVPAEILSRPGKLQKCEFDMIKTHSLVGADIIKDVDFPWPVKEMILHHHERLDGSGYPRGLKEDKITFEAKIIAVSDVVEAMCSSRPYRGALGVDRALNEVVKNSGLLYDSNIVSICVDLFKKKKFQFK